MTKRENIFKNQITLNFIILLPIFFAVSLLFSKAHDAHQQDFALYWQAGHMILNGQNVYDSIEWVAVRETEHTAFHSEPTFQYPLPFAVLSSLFALLPIQFAYTFWIFLAQVGILVSIIILLSFYPARPSYLDILALAGIFLFRPTYSAIGNGQIVPFLLLLLSVSIYLFHDGRWFLGGLILSTLSLKPSVGFPILLLGGMWLLSKKHWRGILGTTLGGFILAVLGALVNYRWIIDYLGISGDSFRKYFGMYPTMWGVVDRIFKVDNISLAVGIVGVVVVLAVEAYLFSIDRSQINSFSAFASILPAALLIAPYSWNYDQLLLTIPIIFLLINLSRGYGMGKTVMFVVGFVVLALVLVIVAYQVGRDVWSFLNPFLIWMFSIYFVIKNRRLQT